MKYETVRKITMTEKERETLRDFVNFIEDSLRDDIEEDPELVVHLLLAIFCRDNLINTSSGEVYVEYIKEREV